MAKELVVADIKKQMRTLIAQLRKYEHAYYALDRPLVADAEYDAQLQVLKQLEAKHPELIEADSPTQRVGGVALDKFVKVPHAYPMLSLNNAFNDDELSHFDVQLKEHLKTTPYSYVVEPKIDGLSLSLIYENGLLVRALTRGDGLVGEDVTLNVKTIKSIPLAIPEKRNVTVRGEVFITKRDFDEINARLAADKQFANCRNLAAGSLRNLDPKITAQRRLRAYFYYLPDPAALGIKTQAEAITTIRAWGLPVAPEICECQTLKDVQQRITWFNAHRAELMYAIDGVVIKLNDLTKYGMLGSTTKFPRWAIAYKFPPTHVQTTLRDIKLTVGRTGKINYAAELERVAVDGSYISSATLHNYDYVTTNDIRIGDRVLIYKAGDVIPKVTQALVALRTGKEKIFVKPTHCPECHQPLEQDPEAVDQYCINAACPARVVMGIVHWCSREAMYLEGVSEQIISALYHAQFIQSIVDLYYLADKKSAIMRANLKIRHKKMALILAAVAASKARPLHNVLFALGIRHVGAALARTLAQHFRSIEALQKASVADLLNVPEVGPAVANAIHDWFKLPTNLQLLSDLKTAGITFASLANESEQIQVDSPYANKTFAISGSFALPRNDLKNLLAAHYGITFKSSPTKNVDYFLAGNAAIPDKVARAKALNIPIITTAFWDELKKQ